MVLENCENFGIVECAASYTTCEDDESEKGYKCMDCPENTVFNKVENRCEKSK